MNERIESNKPSSALILQTQEGDWEALYIDGECIDQGHDLHQGTHYMVYSLKIINKYRVGIISVVTANNEDNELAQKSGRFPDHSSKLTGDYV